MFGGPSPRTGNPNGRVPMFRGNPVPVSEIGFTPGPERNAGTVHNVESREVGQFRQRGSKGAKKAMRSRHYLAIISYRL